MKLSSLNFNISNVLQTKHCCLGTGKETKLRYLPGTSTSVELKATKRKNIDKDRIMPKDTLICWSEMNLMKIPIPF